MFSRRITTFMALFLCATPLCTTAQTPSPIKAQTLVYQPTKPPRGNWFPTVLRTHADSDASALFGLNWEVVFEFRNDKRFDIGSAKEKIIVPEKKP